MTSIALPDSNPHLQALLALSDTELAQYDIAAVNLACASGLPGTESLHF